MSNPTLGVYPCEATFGRGNIDALGDWGSEGERLLDAKDAGVWFMERLGDIERYGELRRGGELGVCEGVEGRELEFFIAERSGCAGIGM